MATAKRVYANNAKGKLNAGIAAGDLSLTLQAGQGALFPTPTAGDWFNATLIDTSGNIEIIKVTTRVTDGFTVIVRAQESTTAISFLAGDKVELRLTKESIEGFVPVTGDVTMTGALTVPAFTATGAVTLGDNAADVATITTDKMVTSLAGGLNLPLQSAFLATAGAKANVTGDGTVYTMIYETEIFDQNADYDPTTGVFTAPVTGKYWLSANVRPYDALAQQFEVKLVTSNRTYVVAEGSTFSGSFGSFTGTFLCDMDAGDTAYVTFTQFNGAKTVDTSAVSYFSGCLAC